MDLTPTNSAVRQAVYDSANRFPGKHGMHDFKRMRDLESESQTGQTIATPPMDLYTPSAMVSEIPNSEIDVLPGLSPEDIKLMHNLGIENTPQLERDGNYAAGAAHSSSTLPTPAFNPFATSNSASSATDAETAENEEPDTFSIKRMDSEESNEFELPDVLEPNTDAPNTPTSTINPFAANPIQSNNSSSAAGINNRPEQAKPENLDALLKQLNDESVLLGLNEEAFKAPLNTAAAAVTNSSPATISNQSTVNRSTQDKINTAAKKGLSVQEYNRQSQERAAAKKGLSVQEYNRQSKERAAAKKGLSIQEYERKYTENRRQYGKAMGLNYDNFQKYITLESQRRGIDARKFGKLVRQSVDNAKAQGIKPGLETKAFVDVALDKQHPILPSSSSSSAAH